MLVIKSVCPLGIQAGRTGARGQGAIIVNSSTTPSEMEIIPMQDNSFSPHEADYWVMAWILGRTSAYIHTSGTEPWIPQN